MAKIKPYFFTSKHHTIKERKFNEIHPCRIAHDGIREYGWYINSHMKYSKFRGYRVGNFSFGLISGYRSYRIPYITIHTKDGFIAPCFLLGVHSPYLIVCTYGKPGVRQSFRQIWRKLREKSQTKDQEVTKKKTDNERSR